MLGIMEEEKVRVVVRIRPLQPSEESKGHVSVVRPVQTDKGSEVEVIYCI